MFTHLLGVYKWKGGLAGFNVNYYRYADNRTAVTPIQENITFFTPYVIAQVGPVALQANSITRPVKTAMNRRPPDRMPILKVFQVGWMRRSISECFMRAAALRMCPATLARATIRLKTCSGGRDWNPCLIMFNWDRFYWQGALNRWTSTFEPLPLLPLMWGIMNNAWFGQIRGGVRPIADLDIMASVSYAEADKLPTGFCQEIMVGEVDVVATYKITSNLSYMVGAGYLFTGDYFVAGKGADLTTPATADVEDNFIVLNKLTLTF